MKKLIITAAFFSFAFSIVSCGGAKGEDPGQAYMPDMYYSRAYETYGYNNVEGEYDSLKARGVTYTGIPVPGTIARGEMGSYYLTPDSAGLLAAEALKNPLDSMAMTKGAMKEAERLYLIYCGVCHGDKLDGNGPLPAGGAYISAPKNLMADDAKAFSDGRYFHVITFGIRSMGSYASQLTPGQRWWVIKYIRSRQAAGAKPGTDTTSAAGLGQPKTGPKQDTANRK